MKKRASLPRPDRQSLPSAIEAEYMLSDMSTDFDIHSGLELVEIGGEIFLVASGEVVGWYPRGRDSEMSVIAIGSKVNGRVWYGFDPPRWVPRCGVMWFPRAEFRPIGG